MEKTRMKFQLQTANRRLEQINCQLPTYVTIWGTGTPRREFLYVDDLADAIYYLMNKVNAKQI